METKKHKSFDESLLLAGKEATFAYHTSIHGQSFKSSDCTSKLVSKLFKPKFALRRTKCEVVLTNCIAPMIVAELRQELNKKNFISASIDISNRKEIKIVPVVICCFVPDVGEKLKLLEFKSLGGETAATLSKYVFRFSSKMVSKKNLLGFAQIIVTPALEI